MIWDTNSSAEFPSVQNFALQKKLAIMLAHDSILSAHIKQTRDTNHNHKQQVAPFQRGEMVYLSSKNIHFSKGPERPVDNTGLTERATDRTNASSLHKVKLESNEGLKKKENYIQKGSCQRSVIEVVCSYIQNEKVQT